MTLAEIEKHQRHEATIRMAARMLNCDQGDVPSAIEKAKAKLEATRREIACVQALIDNLDGR